MASWTAPSDVLNAWIGEGKPTDTSLVQVWIDKAEREIRRKVPGVQARIDAEAAETPALTDLLEDTKDVTVDMVTRVLRNPQGARQIQTVTGPFTDSVTLAGESPGTLFLTEGELAKLEEEEPEGGAFSIDLIPSTSPFYAGAS